MLRVEYNVPVNCVKRVLMSWFTCSSSFSGVELGMKQEPQDDGYETSGDLELRSQGDAHKLMTHMGQAPAGHNVQMNAVKREPPEDPYSFVDDEPAPPAVPQARGPGPGPGHPPVLQQPVPKKRGRKKKINIEG